MSHSEQEPRDILVGNNTHVPKTIRVANDHNLFCVLPDLYLGSEINKEEIKGNH